MLYTQWSSRLTVGSARVLLGQRSGLRYSTSVKYFKWKSSRLDHLLANMPKEEPHLKDLKEKRMAKRSARALSQPANITWQVLGSGAVGAPRSLILHTDHRRYLFNCGEGSQRLTSQLGLSKALSQMEHVFITSKSWANLGGLPGMCLSARACGAPDVTIHGPPGCMQLYEATKGFILLFEFDVLEHRVEDGEFSDGAVSVRSVLLPRSEDLAAPEVKVEWEGLLEVERQEGAIRYQNSAIAYICSFSPKPGRLDIDACVERGVPPGPLLGKLKAGQDVVLEDGRTVRAVDVVASTEPPSAYLVLEVPDTLYLAGLEAAEELLSIDHLHTVFHFSPPDVVATSRYQNFMAKLGTNVSHVIINSHNSGLGLPDVSAHQHKLHHIRPDLFPLLQGAGDHNLRPAQLRASLESQVPGSGQVIKARTGLKVNVRPQRLHPIDLSMVTPFLPDETTKELLHGCSKLIGSKTKVDYEEGMKKDLLTAQTYSPDPLTSLSSRLKVIDGSLGKKEQAPSASKDHTENYPIVTMLGTGSSVPSKYRNVTGILVETEPGSWILLDCGEGTFGQMVRLYGLDRTKQVLRGLKAIYISHQHADHHIGMINVMLAREEAFRDVNESVVDLLILATKRLAEFLTYYHSRLQPILCHAELVQCEHLVMYDDREEEGRKVQLLYADRMAQLLERVGLESIATCKAIHCPHAFCLSFTTKEGFKMAYSGDTRPNPAFRDLCMMGGRGPDLLVHEATMEHFMINDARIKKHSTITEAVEEGEGMNAEFTLLTHFSQRYAKMPPLDELMGRKRVGIAFDNMVVKPHQLNTIPGIYPAISRWMWDHLEDMQRKAEHYKRKFVKGHQGQDGLGDLGITSLAEEREQLAAKLEKRFQDKEEFLRKINRKKELKAVRGDRVTVVEQKAEEKRQKRMRSRSPEEPLM